MPKKLLIAALAVLAAVSLYMGIKNALEYSQDFQWDAAKALCMRLDPYELSFDHQKIHEYPDLLEFYRFYTDRKLDQKMEANQFPSLLFLLAPMTALSPNTARIAWMILNLAFVLGIIVLLKKTFFRNTDTAEYALISLLMLAGTPFRNQIGVGQHTLFAFFFFMLAVWLEVKSREGEKRYTPAISLCLFVSYFKYTLTAPLALYFIYRKRYRELLISIGAHAVLTVLSALWLGKSVIYVLTAPLKVASALTAEGGIDLGVLIGGPAAYAVAFAVMVLLLVITCKLPSGRDQLLFSLLILWSLILTYHRTYDFFVLSAVSMLFCEGSREVLAGTLCRVYMIWFACLIFGVYFGLRIFHENTLSKICVGIIYYAFTLAVTYIAVRQIRNKRTV